MTKRLTVTVPERDAGTVLQVLEEKNIRNAVKMHAGNSFVINARIPDVAVDDLIGVLERCGVGVYFGMIEVFPLDASKPTLPETSYQISKKGPGTSVVEKVRKKILSGASIDFDFLSMMGVASVIAGAGLAQGNAVIVVSSMLLSPLMGPLLAIAFGLVVHEKSLTLIGIRNEIIATVIAIAIGIVIGGAFAPFAETLEWPTGEMSSRGELLGLVFGVVVATASGVGVALAVTSDNVGSLVGVAISASLLPPAVNTGMNIALAVFGHLVDEPHVAPSEAWRIAGISFALLMINDFLIVFVGYFTFRLKQVGPFKRKTPFWVELNSYDAHSDSLYHGKQADSVAAVAPIGGVEVHPMEEMPIPELDSQFHSTVNLGNRSRSALAAAGRAAGTPQPTAGSSVSQKEVPEPEPIGSAAGLHEVPLHPVGMEQPRVKPSAPADVSAGKATISSHPRDLTHTPAPAPPAPVAQEYVPAEPEMYHEEDSDSDRQEMV